MYVRHAHCSSATMDHAPKLPTQLLYFDLSVMPKPYIALSYQSNPFGWAHADDTSMALMGSN